MKDKLFLRFAGVLFAALFAFWPAASGADTSGDIVSDVVRTWEENAASFDEEFAGGGEDGSGAGTDSRAGEKLRLVFIGDVMAHIEQVTSARRPNGSYDFSPQFRRVLPLFDGAFVTANLETVLGGEADGGYTGYPMFNTPDSLATALREAGVRVVTVANNHSLDRRERGLARTLGVVDGAGLARVGAGATAKGERHDEPLLIEAGGFRLAFINYTYGSNVPPSKEPLPAARICIISPDLVAESVREARSLSPDLVIACFHWGDEYVYKPKPKDSKLADAVASPGGADLVIGTHPHVMQPIEVRRGSDERERVIAWSLGNFISHQRTIPRERSVILAIDAERGEDGSAAVTRVSVAPTWVSERRVNGQLSFEVVYAGEGGRFNHAGLPASELSKARAAGRTVLEFLGAKGGPDADGFYTLWSADAPDDRPVPRRASPK